MPAINDVNTSTGEIVLTERVVTNEWKIVQVVENIENRFVRAEVELGPFITETGPGGQTDVRGSGRRSIVVWSDTAYDAVRDTWTNADLMAAIQTIIAPPAV